MICGKIQHNFNLLGKMYLFSASVDNSLSVTPLVLALTNSRELSFTGLVHARPADGFPVDVVVVSGRVLRAYVFTASTRPESLTESQFQSRLAAFENFHAVQVKLPAHALRLYMLFAESAGDGDSRLVPTSEVVSLLPGWQSLQDPSLVSFHWPSADALLFLPGGGSFARHSVFVSGAKVDQEVIPAIEMWAEPTCRLIRHAPIPNTAAWREYHLHLTFTAIFNAFMVRYEQFGGRPVITDLVNQLTELSQEQGWNIGFVGAKMFDRQLFADEKQAARLYRALLRAVLSHAEAVLGAPRTESMLKLIISQSDSFARSYAQDFELLPGNLPSGGD